MLSIREDLYSNTNGHVTVGDFISDNFEINLGVKQSDPSSPFIFNVYMNEWTMLKPHTNGKRFPHNQFNKYSTPFLGRWFSTDIYHERESA